MIGMSKPLDAALSQEIATRIKSSKSSFDNAYNAALIIEGAKYVQGFLVMAGAPFKPIEHSWIEIENCLIDPSLPRLNKKPQELYYFPAQSLTVKQLKAAVEEAKEDYPEDPPLPIYGTAPYSYYGDIMLGGAEYQAAHEEALIQCRELNKPKTNGAN
jgi:hypothetical protein